MKLCCENAEGFNRYIVECKLKRTLSLYIGNVRFNRYIVECKYKQEKDIKAGEWVLIDT